MLTLVLLLVAVGIAYFGGVLGVLYVMVGVGLAFLDWRLWQRPMILAAGPQLRSYMPELCSSTDAALCDAAHQRMMSMWTSRLREAQLVVVPLWAVPIYWPTALRIYYGLVGGPNALAARQRSVQLQVQVLLGDDEIQEHARQFGYRHVREQQRGQ